MPGGTCTLTLPHASEPMGSMEPLTLDWNSLRHNMFSTIQPPSGTSEVVMVAPPPSNFTGKAVPGENSKYDIGLAPGSSVKKTVGL